jgi:hypothetical protein
MTHDQTQPLETLSPETLEAIREKLNQTIDSARIVKTDEKLQIMKILDMTRDKRTWFEKLRKKPVKSYFPIEIFGRIYSSRLELEERLSELG